MAMRNKKGFLVVLVFLSFIPVIQAASNCYEYKILPGQCTSDLKCKSITDSDVPSSSGIPQCLNEEMKSSLPKDADCQFPGQHCLAMVTEAKFVFESRCLRAANIARCEKYKTEDDNNDSQIFNR
jgi:hypothetical protein